MFSDYDHRNQLLPGAVGVGMNARTESLMKRCQVGDGRWPGDANDLLAECYGHMGKQQDRIRRLEALLSEARGRVWSLEGEGYSDFPQRVDEALEYSK